MADTVTFFSPHNGDNVTSPVTVELLVTKDAQNPNDLSDIVCDVTLQCAGSTDPKIAFYDPAGPPNYTHKCTCTLSQTGAATLTAQTDNGPSSPYNSASVTISVNLSRMERREARRPPNAGGFGGSVTIASPQPGATVQCAFTATGSISGAQSYNVSGSITDTTGVVYNGTTTSPGDSLGNPWSIDFTAPPGSLLNCVLKVWCTDDATVFAQESLGGASGGSGGAGGGHGHFNV
jgi:hypothetical protein